MTVVVIIAIWVGIAIIYNLISKKGFIKCFFLIPVNIALLFFKELGESGCKNVRQEAKRQGRTDIVSKIDAGRAQSSNIAGSLSNLKDKIK